MFHAMQPIGLSDADHILTCVSKAASHRAKVTAVFRGGKSIVIEPGTPLYEAEARSFREFGKTGWRTPIEIGEDERRAIDEARTTETGEASNGN